MTNIHSYMMSIDKRIVFIDFMSCIGVLPRFKSYMVKQGTYQLFLEMFYSNEFENCPFREFFLGDETSEGFLYWSVVERFSEIIMNLGFYARYDLYSYIDGLVSSEYSYDVELLMRIKFYLKNRLKINN